MDKIVENIYNMDDRTYDIFKFLCVWCLIAFAVTIYFTLQIPYKLAERERIIAEWEASHPRDGIDGAVHMLENDSIVYPRWITNDVP